MSMTRLGLVLVLLFTQSACLRAGDTAMPPGAYLGVLFSPVDEVRLLRQGQRFLRPFLGGLNIPIDSLTAQIPPPIRLRGVVVTEVLPDSPAAKADLRRGDVLLRYDDEAILDCRDFARLMQNDKPERKVKLLVRRDSKETTVVATMALGPAIRIAPLTQQASRSVEGVRAIAKPAARDTVSVAAAPLADGKMKVIVEYYPKGSEQPASVTCQGNAGEIEKALRDTTELTTQQKELARVALDRVRSRLKPRGPNGESK